MVQGVCGIDDGMLQHIRSNTHDYVRSITNKGQN